MKSSIAASCGAVVLSLFAIGCGGGGGTTNRTIPVVPTAKPNAPAALWVANGANVVEFGSPLQAGAAPRLINNSKVFGAPQGVQFDAAGDLWVIDGGTVAAGGTVKPGLYKFTPQQLAALATSNSPTPATTVAFPGLTFPQQAVFDRNGDMWVTDNGANAVYEFTPAQLAAGGTNVTPNATITSNFAFNGPLGIAFDQRGDLYIANNGGTTIDEFNAALFRRPAA